MTQSMAHELGPHGINVNCVCPGAVDTHRMDDIDRDVRWIEMAANTPIRRNGTDDEVGRIRCVPLLRCRRLDSWPVHQHKRRHRNGALGGGTRK